MKAYYITGLTSKKDLDIVYEWAAKVPENGTIIEIGAFLGRTAVALAEGAPPSATIYSIDYFTSYKLMSAPMAQNANGPDAWHPEKIYNTEEELIKNTKDYKNIIPLKLDQHLKVYPYNKEPIDLLFLDGRHQNPDDMINLLYFRKFLKPNALICGHDYHPDFPDVISNTIELEKMYKTMTTLYQHSCMWSIRIRE
jgi:predicted O-methyltransferase YrrM